MATVQELIATLDQHLGSTGVKDYGPNGLQVDGGRTAVTRVVTGVTANLAFIHEAISKDADLLIVHHGVYWDGAPHTATGALGRRLRTLIKHGISLAAYHLPLDGHPVLGNAAQLANALGLDESERHPAFEHRGVSAGVVVTLNGPMSADELRTNVVASVNPDALCFLNGPEEIRRIGIITGGAARDVGLAANTYGCDAFITGEAAEYSLADSKEEGIHFLAAGHHRSERFGPMALARWLSEAYPELSCEFIDIDNPV